MLSTSLTRFLAHFVVLRTRDDVRHAGTQTALQTALAVGMPASRQDDGHVLVEVERRVADFAVRKLHFVYIEPKAILAFGMQI